MLNKWTPWHLFKVSFQDSFRYPINLLFLCKNLLFHFETQFFPTFSHFLKIRSPRYRRCEVGWGQQLAVGIHRGKGTPDKWTQIFWLADRLIGLWRRFWWSFWSWDARMVFTFHRWFFLISYLQPLLRFLCTFVCLTNWVIFQSSLLNVVNPLFCNIPPLLDGSQHLSATKPIELKKLSWKNISRSFKMMNHQISLQNPMKQGFFFWGHQFPPHLRGRDNNNNNNNRGLWWEGTITTITTTGDFDDVIKMQYCELVTPFGFPGHLTNPVTSWDLNLDFLGKADWWWRVVIEAQLLCNSRWADSPHLGSKY